MASLACNASVLKSEEEFYLALETESFSVCAGPDRLLVNHQGRLPRIDACSTQTMLITLKVKGEQIMSDNPGIGKQVASSVVCTTHDCFILSSLPRSCLCDTYCTKLHPLGICES